MIKEMRNSGLDCFRILLTLFVCVIHVLGQGGILKSTSLLKCDIYWLINVFAYCAIDGYALLSGYASNSTKLNLKRIINLWFEIIFYSLVLSIIINAIQNNVAFNVKELTKCCMPILFNKYWYMTAYFPLFFLTPIINKGIEKIQIKDAKYLLAILIIMFSFLGTIRDNYVSDGYHFLWLLVLFVIGALLKKLNLFEKTSSKKLLCYYLLSIIISWIPLLLFDNKILISYISPTVLFACICLLTFFSRLNCNNKIVNLLYPLTTGVYLFQNNEIIWNILANRFIFVAEYSIFFGLISILFLSLFIFITGCVIDYIRIILYKILKIDALSCFLSKKITVIFSKKIHF